MTRALLDDNVTGTASIIEVVSPTVNASTGGAADVLENADTEKICSPNSVIKYINIRLSSGVRDISPSAPGFQQYAIVVFEEQKTIPVLDAGITSGLGTQTLGRLCKNLYRGNCIWENAFPISVQQPWVENIKLKIPAKFCANKIGKYIMLIKSFQTNNVSDTTSDARTWYQHMYKCYL